MFDFVENLLGSCLDSFHDLLELSFKGVGFFSHHIVIILSDSLSVGLLSLFEKSRDLFINLFKSLCHQVTIFLDSLGNSGENM